MKQKTKKPVPELAQLQAELERVRYKSRYRSVLRSTIYALVVVAAVAVLEKVKLGRMTSSPG